MKKDGNLILGEGYSCSRNCFETKRNNNVCCIGASGSGKTRYVVLPNLLQKDNSSSFVISDPKGQLHKQWGGWFIAQGYDVHVVDLIHLDKAHYNPFENATSEMDIHKVAYMLAGSEAVASLSHTDPFWDQTSCMLLETIIHVLHEHPRFEMNLANVLRIMTELSPNGDEAPLKYLTDRVLELQHYKGVENVAVSQYRRFYSIAGSDKTLASILMTLNAKLSVYATKEVEAMTATNDVDWKRVATKKSVIFLTVSDVDHSLYPLASLFISQAFQKLCEYADEQKSGSLPNPVVFLLDDFASFKIDNFPLLISNMRSRNISAMIFLQSEEQLIMHYGADANTIIQNCDSYIYLGGNNFHTAQSVAVRANVPLDAVLNMEVGNQWVFRRGCKPKYTKSIDLNRWMLHEVKERPDIRK